jgi:hypothetical protein
MWMSAPIHDGLAKIHTYSWDSFSTGLSTKAAREEMRQIGKMLRKAFYYYRILESEFFVTFFI